MRPNRWAVAVGLAAAASSFASAAERHWPRTLGKAAVLVANADRALKLGNLRKAEKGYARALHLLPDLPEGHLGRGHVLMRRGEFDPAYRAYLEAERCYRGEAANLLDHQAERYHAAQTEASDLRRRASILRHNVERLEALLADADGRNAARQNEILQSLLSEVRRLEVEIERLDAIPPPAPPTEDGVPGDVFFFLGNALLNLDRLSEAAQAWETCAGRMPSHPLVYNNLAAAYWKLGRVERARASLLRAEELGIEINAELREKIRSSR